MALTLTEWDQSIAPKVALMRMDISNAIFHINKARARMMEMQMRPEFDTMVEDDIRRARVLLEEGAQMLNAFELEFQAVARDE